MAWNCHRNDEDRIEQWAMNSFRIFMYNGLKPNEWNYHLKLIESNKYYYEFLIHLIWIIIQVWKRVSSDKRFETYLLFAAPIIATTRSMFDIKWSWIKKNFFIFIAVVVDITMLENEVWRRRILWCQLWMRYFVIMSLLSISN